MVIQAGAVIMIVLALFGKFGAVFTTIPDPVVGETTSTKFDAFIV